MNLSERQEKIISIIKENQPITGDAIAEQIGLTRATLRPDLAVLSMCKMIDAKPKVGYFISNTKSSSAIMDKLLTMKLYSIKSVPVIIDEKTSVYEAIVTIFVQDVGTLFVAENNVLKGIVSRKDLLKAAMGSSDLKTIPISVIMTRVPKAIYCTEDDSIIDVAEKIIENDIDCVPIVEFDENGEMIITGRVSKTNITKALIELAK